MRLPDDVALMRSVAYGHKVRAAFHKRRHREAMAKLTRRCEELGIPVPPVTTEAPLSSHEGEPRGNHPGCRAAA